MVQILEWLQQIFWVSEYLGNLRYMYYPKIWTEWFYHTVMCPKLQMEYGKEKSDLGQPVCNTGKPALRDHPRGPSKVVS